MAKSSNVIGIAAILLILAAGNENGKHETGLFKSSEPAGKRTGSASKNAGIGGILPSIEVGGILKDLHRLTFIMNQMDNLGQMALHPSERPKLPPPSEIISKAIPDLGNIIETVAPLLSALNGDSAGSISGKDSGASFFGNSSDNSLFGGAKNDSLFGYTQNDSLFGNERENDSF